MPSALTTGPPPDPPHTRHPLQFIHRAPDSYLAFGAKSPNGWHDLFSTTPAQLDTLPPAATRCLGSDAYFTINGMYRGGHGASRIVPQLPRAFRGAGGLRYLNAAFTDLDIYKAGRDVEQTIAAVSALTAAGTIPPPSIIVRSGRGVWLLWLLSDDATGLPPRSYAVNLRTYRRLQGTIRSRLSHLGADPNATDAARMMRVPGSIHSGSGKPVTFEVQPYTNGQPASYTLDTLASAFGVPPAPDRPGKCRPTGNASDAKPSGWANVHRSRVRQIERLQVIRGGFEAGCRNVAALILAVSLSASGMSRLEVFDRVRSFGALCRPSLTERECESAVKSGRAVVALPSGATRPKYIHSNAEISKRLGITAAEAGELETWKPAKEFRSAVFDDDRTSRADRQTARHKLIVSLIQDAEGVLLPQRHMVRLLKELGHKACLRTVQKDYAALGLLERRHPVAECSPSTLTPSEAA